MKKKSFFQCARFYITGIILLFCAVLVKAQPQIAVPDGFAGYAGTTGGGNATPITVSSASAFKSAVSGNNAAVIYVDGFLNIGNVSIGSNKTIVGLTESSGIGGGKISVNGSNYIFQNLIVGPGSSDVMEISGGSKVFITKCSFHDCGDELLSIVRGADNVTVSWCKFYFEKPHDHALAHLIGNSDGASGDKGKLKTTMHHNWYAEGIRSRMPRVRYGQVHIYNNYYNSVGNEYTIGVGVECRIRLENTHFNNVNAAWNDMGGASSGRIGWSNLLFESTSTPTFISNSYPVFTPPYSFSLDPVANVEAIVKAGAGNVMGTNETRTLSVSVNGQGSVSPSGGQFAKGSTVTLKATGDAGWVFDSWSGDASGSANPLSLVMNSDKSVTAKFTKLPANSYTLTTSVNGQGSVSGAGTYVDGAVACITATPASGWTFTGWSGDASGTENPVCITMNGNKSVTANFSGGSGEVSTITIQENENGFCSVDGSIDNNNAGFTGSGFANTDNANDKGITWSVNVPSAGTYKLAWRIANGGSANRNGEVMVGGAVKVSNVDFPSTGSWTTYTVTPSVDVALPGGTSLIRLQATQSSGLANIDYLQVTGVNPTPVACSGLKSASMVNHNAEINVNIYPNPVNDVLNIEFSGKLEKEATINLMDMSGKPIKSFKTNDMNYSLDISDLSGGMYVVRISGSNLNITKTISKE